MFRARKSLFYDEESVLSILTPHEIALPVSRLDVLWKGEEMEACWISLSIIIAISTIKSGTMSSSSIRRKRRSILRRETVIHYRNILMETTGTREQRERREPRELQRTTVPKSYIM